MLFKKIVLMGLVSLLLVGACSANEQQKTAPGGAYISFTFLEELVCDCGEEHILDRQRVYEYDLKTQKITEKFDFACHSYSTAVYDKASNAVYYVDMENPVLDKKGRFTGRDQIFMHSFSTNTEYVLTHNLYAVNHLLPVEDGVFFVAARQDDPNPNTMMLGKADPSGEETLYWAAPFPQASVDSICVDRAEKRVYVSVYDADARRHATQTDGPTVTHSVYSFDYHLQDCKEVLRKEGMRVYGLDVRDGELFYHLYSHERLGANPPDPVYQSEKLDLQTGESTLVQEEMVGRLAPDKKGVFQVMQETENGPQGIFYYDLAAQEMTEVVDGSYNPSHMVLFD